MLRNCAVISGFVLATFAGLGLASPAEAICGCRHSGCARCSSARCFSGCCSCNWRYSGCGETYTCYGGCNTCVNAYSGGCFSAGGPYAPAYDTARGACTGTFIAGARPTNAPPVYAAPIGGPARYAGNGNLSMPQNSR